eukprot:CAMPEP_0119300214 /NCGR_PEP_ID=MMETSP1333-20130426/2201_1 /TAXON_ID=418940 /ORGANISM="Scyphosphaera apsteinii, Strain RCC1455" /LENGTH=316 /DNA_ID=CAMNT_0007301911 /DNA_START=95 /DNA_END=1045 /DNA_ORIENTATION=-
MHDASFANESFEAAFKADVFRLAFLLHVAHFTILIVVLLIGLFDSAFRLISACLLPLGIFELLLRIMLHSMRDYCAAQHMGALAMLCLTTIAWCAYLVTSLQRVDESPASLLMTTLISLMMLVYPLQLRLFLLGPWQRAAAKSTAVITIFVAPPLSELPKSEELCLHFFALLTGSVFAYAMERLLREVFMLKFAKMSDSEAKIKQRLDELRNETKNCWRRMALQQTTESSIHEHMQLQRNIHDLEQELVRLANSPSRRRMALSRQAVMLVPSGDNRAGLDVETNATLMVEKLKAAKMRRGMDGRETEHSESPNVHR